MSTQITTPINPHLPAKSRHRIANPPTHHDRPFWLADEPNAYMIVTTMGKEQTGRRWMIDSHCAQSIYSKCNSVRYPVARCSAAERRAEEAAEMDRRIAELTAKNAQLQERNRNCAAYIADVAHELRNSLLTLNFYVDLLTGGHNGNHAAKNPGGAEAEQAIKPEGKQEHYRRMARQSVERLRQFVEDTLSLSRLEVGGAHSAEWELVDLNLLAGEIVALHQAQAEMAGLTLTFAPAHDLPLVQGDARLLSQVVVNLVSNAIKYTKQGWVQVSVAALRSGQVGIDVIDSGIGIAAGALPHIFERFYRAEDAKSSSIPGTGLGLAIVKEIVKLHHGKITVDSTPQTGSHFRVRLPIAGAS